MVVRMPIAARLRVLALSHPMLVRKIIVSHVNAKDLYFLRFLVLQTIEKEHAYVTALSGRSQFGELWKTQHVFAFKRGARWAGVQAFAGAVPDGMAYRLNIIDFWLFF